MNRRTYAILGILVASGLLCLGTIYNPPSSAGAVWGAITGTLASQTDLQTAIDGKVSDTAYNATTWDGVTTVAPSKNTVRDKVVTMDAATATAQVTASNASTAAATAQITADAAAVAVAAIPLVIVANAEQLAKTDGRTLLDYTPSVGKYRVGVWATITAVSVDVLQIQCTWSDQNGVSRTKTFFPQGLTSANLGSTGAYVFPTMDISTDAGSNILVEAILTVGAGSITYDAGSTIQTLPIPSP